MHLQSAQGWKCFYLLDNKEKCGGFIWLHLENETASSPLHAPFGSFEFDETLAADVFYDFIELLQSELQKLGVRRLLVKHYPERYEPTKSALLYVILLNLNFVVSHAEVSSIIPIDTDSYNTHITEWELRKLKQAKGEGLIFDQHTAEQLNTLYTFIEKCRIEKGYKLSLSFPQLHALQNAFPSSVLLFTIKKQSELAAACIAIRVSENVLYTFYYDHSAEFNAYSPVVLLMEGIYSYCQQTSIQLLDLGTASLNGQPNFKLLDFKRHLGGLPAAKLTFMKTLT